MFFKTFVISKLLLMATFLQAEVRINEVMASNVRSFPNAMDFEDYPDWLELSNSGEAKSLFGYYLSDDPTNLQKWAFSAGAVIGAGEQLVIVADGYDRRLGSSERRDYPGGGYFWTQFHHTNFKLSSAGEEIILAQRSTVKTPLILPAASWSYWVPGGQVPGNWAIDPFDDSIWPSGTAGFGYDAPYYGDLATGIDYGGEAGDKHITTYFRREFTIPDEVFINSKILYYEVNDGAVVYLNGEEISRYNLPEGAIAPETLASEELSPFGQVTRTQIQLPPEKLRAGVNVFTVEVHQAAPASGDLFFDFYYNIEYFDFQEAQFFQLGTDFEGSEWRYLDDGSAPAAGWTSVGFDDSGWEEGESGFGYFVGETPLTPAVTDVPYGDQASNKPLRNYFRKEFQVESLSLANGLLLTYQIDDGAKFYLNGYEIFSENVNPTTEVLEPTSAATVHPYKVVPLPSNSLRVGLNTLAVVVYQADSASPSMRFDASLELKEWGDTEVVDRIAFTQQVDDISLGRSEDDPESWVYFESPSPGAINGGETVNNLRETAATVEVLPRGGLYEVAESLTMTTPSGEVRYTTDGSNPAADSSLYTGPFEIVNTTVIRARVFEPGKVPGEIVTQTYFMGETFASGLPVVSLTAPPETLFGEEIGIYGFVERPGGNIHKGVDAPGNLEFFPTDGSEGFSVNGGFRLGGENNFLSHAQKAFNFLTRGRYGDDALNYDVFPGSGVGIFTGLTLREGGDDWGKAHLTDAIWDPLVKGKMEAETSRYRPVSLFVNGAYWGLYNLRDRWDENWFFQDYGTDRGDYDHVKVGRGVDYVIENGDDEDWRELISFLETASADDPEVQEVLRSEIDFDSVIDFMLSQTYGRNSSWGGNREWWRDHRSGSKWRCFLPDMDRTFGNTTFNSNMEFLLSRDVLLRVLQNVPEFRSRLLQRSAAHCAGTLSETRVKSLIREWGDLAAPEIVRQASRWGAPSTESYELALVRMEDFATAREGTYLPELASSFGGVGIVDLTLSVSGEGSFRMAGVEIEAQTLSAFSSVEFELEALAAPGFRFDRWTGAEGGAVTNVSFEQATEITAHFVPDSSSGFGGEIVADTVFTVGNSPYVITGEDLIVPEGVTLTIEAGVVLEFASGKNLRVMGTLVVAGVAGNEVTFKGRHGAVWGGVSFEETATTSSLAHLIVRDASRGVEPLRYPSAISGFDADVVMDFIDISATRGPLFFRGGSMILRDSLIEIPLTGDGINVKGGAAQTIRCTFTGSRSPDTDAIDYDGVIDGLIQDCRMYNFQGFNSDGIDIGESCVNCLIEGNVIYYNSDKGVSVGQNSSVILRRNLIVGSLIGVAVKDFGSTVTMEQNTIVDCAEGVAVYEKNFGGGGGDAVVVNTIFSGCDEPVTVDSYSTLSVRYCLSDTGVLPGENNLFGDPLFVDAARLNFELTPVSPAIDAGDPASENDPDGSRVDMGAAYSFLQDDYPFDRTPTVVVNEILANSGDLPDWIELYNRTAEAIDISGWFLSDDGDQLAKYRIPAGTVIGAGGFVTFFEDLNFGDESLDPGRLEGFALSDTGETVYLSSAVGDQLTYYRFEEDFGPSLEGSTIGVYDKSGNGSFDFVSLKTPTPGALNSSPLMGPLVISEIMYHSEVEYLELLNISAERIVLVEGPGMRPWRIDRGIEFQFPGNGLVLLDPNERLILTEDEAAFRAKYDPASGLKIGQWASGKLSNGGETIQLERPGPLTDLGAPTYIRVDRVKYDDQAPWDPDADGSGLSLTRIYDDEYGNDFANWQAVAATPGRESVSRNFDEWALNRGLDGPNGDDDGDGRSNILEYAFGSDPLVAGESQLLTATRKGGVNLITFPLEARRPDLEVGVELSWNLQEWYEAEIEFWNGRSRVIQSSAARRFYRLKLRRLE